MQVLEADGGDQVVLRFEGVFNSTQASEAHETLFSMGPGTRVTLDFGQVREFHDVAFALLSQDLLRFKRPAGPIDLSVTGLRQHQARILKYLGISGLEPPERPDADSGDAEPVPAQSGMR